MVEEALSQFGLFIDSENKIRLIDPERLTDSAELRDECKDFVDSTSFARNLPEAKRALYSCRRAGVQEDRGHID